MDVWCANVASSGASKHALSLLYLSVVIGYVRTFMKSGCAPNTALGYSIFETLAAAFYTASLTLGVVQHTTSLLPGWHAWLVFCTHCEHSCRWLWHV